MAADNFSADARRSPGHALRPAHLSLLSSPMPLAPELASPSLPAFAHTGCSGLLPEQASPPQPYTGSFSAPSDFHSNHLPATFPFYSYPQPGSGMSWPEQTLSALPHSDYYVQSEFPCTNALGELPPLAQQPAFCSDPAEAPMLTVMSPDAQALYSPYPTSCFSSPSMGATPGPPYPQEPDYARAGAPFAPSVPVPAAWPSEQNSEPYATLIYRALMSTPGKRMVLKEIYEWFEKHTDKAKDPKSKGWQNSIRHNLSMNGAFRKEEQTSPSDDGKRNYVWVLEQSAIDAGFVESTTRYRKPGVHKKGACTYQKPGSSLRASRAPRSRTPRHKKLLGPYAQHPPAHGDALCSDADVEVKHELDCEFQLSPLPLPAPANSQVPALALGSNLALGESGYQALPAGLVPYREMTISQHCSPTPTMTTGSYTDPDSFEFDHVVACSDDATGDPLFQQDAKDARQDSHGSHFPSYWNTYAPSQQPEDLDPLLAELQ